MKLDKRTLEEVEFQLNELAYQAEETEGLGVSDVLACVLDTIAELKKGAV